MCVIACVRVIQYQASLDILHARSNAGMRLLLHTVKRALCWALIVYFIQFCILFYFYSNDMQ